MLLYGEMGTIKWKDTEIRRNGEQTESLIKQRVLYVLEIGTEII